MPQKKKDFKYKSVMLIDDNELDLFVSSTLLRLFKFSDEIQTNNCAITSLDYLKKQVQLNTRGAGVFPDVVFVDLNMPKMDGFQFLEEFHGVFTDEASRPKPVVLSSTLSPKDIIRISAISKDILVLEKPLSKETIDLI